MSSKRIRFNQWTPNTRGRIENCLYLNVARDFLFFFFFLVVNNNIVVLHWNTSLHVLLISLTNVVSKFDTLLKISNPQALLKLSGLKILLKISQSNKGIRFNQWTPNTRGRITFILMLLANGSYKYMQIKKRWHLLDNIYNFCLVVSHFFLQIRE